MIEVYKREHERAYGYYVLPLLAGDRFIGRADLKADRAAGVLRIRRFTPEPRVRGDVDAKLERAAATARPHPRTRRCRTCVRSRVEEARRIAVRAQQLDGSATDVLSTVRRLGFLQLDPISSVAPPQHLVLWSRLGRAYDRAELDRLLWETKQLVEWNAFLWPVEDLPLLRARMRSKEGTWQRYRAEFLKENAAFRRYVLRELEQRGPLLSREIEDHRPTGREAHRWWGERKMGLMLGVLNAMGEVAVVGRRGKQRVWDSPSAGTPRPSGSRGQRRSAARGEAPPVAGRRASARAPDRPPGRRRRPGARRAHHVPLPLRPPRPRPQPRARALGLLLPPRDVRPEGEARVRLLRPADPAR